MPVERHQLGCFSINCLESEGVATENKVLQFVFNENISFPSIKPAILDQLDIDQNDRYYNFDKYQISSKLQTAFIASTKVHR